MRRAAVLMALAGACAVPVAMAQSYPSKPVRTLVTISGVGEALCRVVGQEMAKSMGVPAIVVALNKCDVADEEMIELSEMDVRDLLNRYEFPGDDLPVVRVAAFPALNGDEKWGESIMELMNAVDAYIPTPERAVDMPFLMPVEDVFTITGRGTVVTGRIERGIIKVNEEVEIVGIRKDTTKTTVTGVEMFRKLLDEGQAGENVGLLLRGTKREDVRSIRAK